MKIFFDENLAARLADAIRVLAQDEDYEVQHVVAWLGPGTSDVNWIKAVGREGGIAITNDHHIRSRPHEIEAWRRYGVIGFVLPKMFNQLPFWDKAAFLIRWWETLVQAAMASTPGDMYFVPSHWSPSPLTKNPPKGKKRGR